MSSRITEQLTIRREFWLQLVVYIVGIHGLFVIATTLLDQIGPHTGRHLRDIDIDIPLLIGLGLVYLSTLLRRRKQNAWFVAIFAYIFMLGFYLSQADTMFDNHKVLQLIGKFALPLLNIILLWVSRSSFSVKSDIRSFGYSLRFIVLILAVAFVYGIGGFMLMDIRDFHHQISLTEAMHHTIDQFGLTTSNELVPQTRRARLFVDSLSVVSIASLAYGAISLFQPIRSRYRDHHDGRMTATSLLENSGGNSEDFFKLWPHDKEYFFDGSRRSGIAYKVKNGVALIIGDPMGEKSNASALLKEFEDVCYGNDWLPVFVHTVPEWSEFYEDMGYRLQKIGEEAIVDLEHFQTVRQGKYFRQIGNKFARNGVTCEMLLPPHNPAILKRLREVSDEWLSKPGRVERTMIMGYFSDEYIQQCPVLVARDGAGTIQAFLSQIPSYDTHEANFDMLRHAKSSPGNVNDFLLMGFIDYLRTQPGIRRLNMGLCPLAGMDDLEEKSVVSRALHFIYDNGDRIYAFSGLHRFKSKYEPEWSDRYLVYKGGVRNLARATNALTRAMRVK